MKLLFVSPREPLPIYGGVEVRLFNLLRSLAQRNTVTLLSFARHGLVDPEVHRKLSELCHSVEFIDFQAGPEPHQDLGRRLISVLFPSPTHLGPLSTSAEMKRAIDSQLATGAFDAVLFSGPPMLSYFLDGSTVPQVFDSCDSLSLYKQRAVRLAPSGRRKVSAFADWVATARFEQRYYCRFREVVFTSETDARQVRRNCPDSNVTVITNGIDCEYYRPAASEPPDPNVIFFGVMDFPPNVDAAVHFGRDVMPLIWKQVPVAQFLVVGRRPAPSVKALADADSRITVTGEVDDIRPWLARSQVCVCPIRTGGGIKNKILEGWASGLPVVATNISIEGTGASPGHNALIADEASDLAAAVTRLLQDPELRRRLGGGGRDTAISDFSWESKAIEFEQALQRAIEHAKRA